MSNEPSRGDLEKFLVAEYASLARKKLETTATGLIALMRAGQMAHASTLFYMRTGMLAGDWPEEFKAFIQKLDEEAARLYGS